MSALAAKAGEHNTVGIADVAKYFRVGGFASRIMELGGRVLAQRATRRMPGLGSSTSPNWLFALDRGLVLSDIVSCR